jgi:hypothetical protein
MADEPYFPAPGAARPEPQPQPAPRRSSPNVVARPEPPSPEVEVDIDGAAKPRPALSRTEMQALLAVGRELQGGGRGRAAWKRGRVIVVPTGLISTVLHVVLGDYALPIILVLCLASIVWVARPLLRRDDWS